MVPSPSAVVEIYPVEHEQVFGVALVVAIELTGHLALQMIGVVWILTKVEEQVQTLLEFKANPVAPQVHTKVLVTPVPFGM